MQTKINYTNQPTLIGNNKQEKKDEIKNYFLHTFTRYESLFDIFVHDDIFYKKSEPTRHPMIFYFGHTAAFYINKLILMNIISSRINKEFESMFAVGVDEMSWDDMDKTHYRYPPVQEVRNYRQKVKKLVLETIQKIDIKLPITPDDDMWVILMGIEHENIHIETSLVLHRQMPLKYIKKQNYKISQTDHKPPTNSLIDIDAMKITLGKPHDHKLYGWDNEYGKKESFVESFKISRYIVSNSEYMQFVDDGGYKDKQYWCQDGKMWLQRSKATCPTFWIKTKDGYDYRVVDRQIAMPYSWPVDVNLYEARAFCRYKSIKSGEIYSLPSEEIYRAFVNSFEKKESKTNNNLIHNHSMPVDMYCVDNVCDITGNVWQWSSSTIYGFDGFTTHKAYDDFSTPTFDGEHYILCGSSWASCGNLTDKHSRYAFRAHFFQNAGFRYVKQHSQNTTEKTQTNIYESDNLVSQYCEFQYGQNHIDTQNFAVSCLNKIKKHITKTTKAFDIGCATGRLSFELARYFDQVDGVDFSANFISVGTKLQQKGVLEYKIMSEGELYELAKIDMKKLRLEKNKNKVRFYQADACNLKDIFKDYDLIIATNLIDRLYDPELFLNDIHHRLNDNGLFVLTSPYTWQTTYTKKNKWLGGYKNKDGKDIKTFETIKQILQNGFKLIDQADVPFVIKETNRKYQYTFSHMSIWKKV